MTPRVKYRCVNRKTTSSGIMVMTAAVVITVLLINVHRIELALPLLLAFSAGLGGVLVAIGVAVVRLKGFAESRWGTGGGRLRRPVSHSCRRGPASTSWGSTTLTFLHTEIALSAGQPVANGAVWNIHRFRIAR